MRAIFVEADALCTTTPSSIKPAISSVANAKAQRIADKTDMSLF